MDPRDSVPDRFSYPQPIPVYAMDTTIGLQPAAPIYQPNQQHFFSPGQGLSYGDVPANSFGIQQQRSMDNMHNPFVNVYHHPFQSVPLSAIQPFESCLPRSAGIYSAPPGCPQYMVSPPTMTLSLDGSPPGTATSQAHASTSTSVPTRWSGSMMSVSLEHPYDVHTFFANSDGTISNLLATPFTPSTQSNEHVTAKRKAKATADDSSSSESSHQRDKRHCLGVRVSLMGAPVFVHASC